jgi:uncharacterized membrane protein
MDIDTIAVLVSAALLTAYYVFLAIGTRRNHDFTIHAVNDRARLIWVRAVMQTTGNEIMAVQTLRNMAMAATFKASSAILLIMGTLTLSAQAESLARAWQLLGIAEHAQIEWWIIKIMALLTALIVAFFSFAMSVRVLNHVVFMINVPAAEAHGALAPDRTAQRLVQAGMFYRLGMRAYFVTVPLVFWLFGPIFLIAATVGLIAVLFFLDRNPAA